MCVYECGVCESSVFEDVHGVSVVGEDVCMRWCMCEDVCVVSLRMCACVCEGGI